tara:strand:- start:2441 stop:2677 length:237 start_codon:yes stop_codon:yes gene_type:complete
MISFLREKLIGGTTGKREMGLAIFIAYCLAWVFSPADRAILATMLTPILLFLCAVYGLEWQSTQSKWKAPSNDEFYSE